MSVGHSHRMLSQAEYSLLYDQTRLTLAGIDRLKILLPRYVFNALLLSQDKMNMRVFAITRDTNAEQQSVFDPVVLRISLERSSGRRRVTES
jgi:hypothetical protein